jgi:hypothetical protein
VSSEIPGATKPGISRAAKITEMRSATVRRVVNSNASADARSSQ